MRASVRRAFVPLLARCVLQRPVVVTGPRRPATPVLSPLTPSPRIYRHRYISVTLLVVMFVFLTIRFLLFLFVWIFGFEFWILPNLFDESLTGEFDRTNSRPAQLHPAPQSTSVSTRPPHLLGHTVTFSGGVVQAGLHVRAHQDDPALVAPCH